MHRRTQDYILEGIHVVGDGMPVPPVGSGGKAPLGGLGERSPQELKQNVKLAYNF